jgi:hypothetical protein
LGLRKAKKRRATDCVSELEKCYRGTRLDVKEKRKAKQDTSCGKKFRNKKKDKCALEIRLSLPHHGLVP